MLLDTGGGASTLWAATVMLSCINVAASGSGHQGTLLDDDWGGADSQTIWKCISASSVQDPHCA